ncbi:MAG TPA: tetratricopeptide repeat protein [Trueperaceae bacterium]
MYLRTFGGLAIEGTGFRRLKPLLLAAYLAHAGPTPRRYLAEIFWPGASDAMNSLSVALSQLRRGAPGAVDADDIRAWSDLDSDAGELRRAFETAAYDRVAEIYSGAFLDGVDLDMSEELEEWLFDTRESLARTAREALLRSAELSAGKSRFDEAGRLAEQALRTAGAGEPEPEELLRFGILLSAARSPSIAELRRLAQEYGLSADMPPEQARARLARVLVGRESELTRLSALAPGEWAWVTGASGMGKTALLGELEGTYLPAREGLPYATLEPLLAETLGASETLMLKRLSSLEGTVMVDDWEQTDEESRKLLTRLRHLRPRVNLIIASTCPPLLPVEVELTLGPLSVDALGPYADSLEQTGGLPELVGALMRDDSLEAALERRLDQLGPDARRLYLALALLERGDVSLVRRALSLPSVETATALGELLPTGLVEASGAVRARQAALDYLTSRPNEMGQLALQLARELSGVEAFPLYERARAFWEENDLPRAAAAYLAWGEELLRRGFARRSAELLSEAPSTEEVILLWSRALEQAGQYKEALERLGRLPETPLVSALKSALYWRLGRPADAEAAAQRGLEGETEARAESLNTLGVLARSQGAFEEAASHARRAAALWQALGNQNRWVSTLNNVGIAAALQGKSAEEAFAEALEASGDNSLLRARTLLNVGWAREQQGQLAHAEEAFLEAARLAAEAGVTEVAAWAWNNLGVLFHRQPQAEKARDAYEQALALAQQAGEQRILGMVLANLAELTSNYEAWEEALRILEKSGHEMIATNFRESLDADHPFARRSEESGGGES